MNKSDIRKKILKIRSNSKLKNNKFNFQKIFQLIKKIRIKSKILGGYYPYNHELDIMEILEKFEKKNYVISLPKIKKKSQMNFFKWSIKDPLMINQYGIPEPISNKVIYPDILLVPLVAFDKNLNRLGYGGGFYDRYIKKIKQNKKVVTIGLAYSFQKVKKIPIQKYDIKLDFIMTERNLYENIISG